jgi:hypothetical protein
MPFPATGSDLGVSLVHAVADQPECWSGRRALERPCADAMMREAYSP